MTMKATRSPENLINADLFGRQDQSLYSTAPVYPKPLIQPMAIIFPDKSTIFVIEKRACRDQSRLINYLLSPKTEAAYCRADFFYCA